MSNNIFYVMGALYATLLITSILLGSVLVLSISAILLFTTVLFYKGWYIIEPLLFRKINIIQTVGSYQLSGERKSAIIKSNGYVSATTAMLIDPSKINELNKEDMENIIQNLKIPFKIIMQVEQLNTSKIVNDLKTKQYMKESELYKIAKLNPKSPKVAALNREISQINNDILEITSGKMPLKLSYYALTSAIAENVYRAQDIAIIRIKELANSIDSVLNTKSNILEGDELLSVLRFDSVVVFK